MRDWTKYHVYLQDELPGIGSGHRHVEALVGRKWTYVRRINSPVNRKYRIKTTSWDALKPETIQ